MSQPPFHFLATSTKESPDHFGATDAGRVVLEDFRPLAESLDWRLGQEYLRQRGSQAFVGDYQPVPFVVNNDGNLSLRAAEVVFASLLEAEKIGKLERDLVVLELGIGVGLFARFFLDAFKGLCASGAKDFYARLTYIAADRSARMLEDAARNGVFRNHPGRYRLLLIDALAPKEGLSACPDIAARARAVAGGFLNYLLDCLPASVLRATEDRLEQLHVRTSLPEGRDWRSRVGVDAAELKRLAGLANAAGQSALQAVYPMCLSEYRYLPANAAETPLGDFALAQARIVEPRPILHSHGAIRCLEALLRLLAEGGVILLADYGQTKETTAEEFEHQRFSLATFVGVNFPLLAAYFKDRPDLRWSEPDEGEAGIHCRLLGGAPAPLTVLRFQECFGSKARDWQEAPAKRARELARMGRVRAALELFKQAIARQPFSWPLLSEMAHLLTFDLRDPRAGLEAARRALALNPRCSPDLWNIAGDALFELNRTTEARRCFEQALQVSPEDVRARYNLAFVHQRRREHQKALVRVAEALALDRMGIYRERLLHKQGEILGQLAEQNQRRFLGQIDRVAGIGFATVG